MAIFNSYVSLPEGIPYTINCFDTHQKSHQLPSFQVRIILLPMISTYLNHNHRTFPSPNWFLSFPDICSRWSKQTKNDSTIPCGFPISTMQISQKNIPLHIYPPDPRHTPLTQGNHFVRGPGVNLTNIHGWGFTKWAGHQAWCDSPANTGEPQKKSKIGSLQNGCPKLISRPQTQSSYKLVS